MKSLKVVSLAAGMLFAGNALAGPLLQSLPLGRVVGAVPALGVASSLGAATPLPRAAAALSGSSSLPAFGRPVFSSTPLPGLEAASPKPAFEAAGCEPLCGGGGGGILGYKINPNYIPKVNFWAKQTIADTFYNVGWLNYTVSYGMFYQLCDGACKPLADPVRYGSLLVEHGPAVILSIGNNFLGGTKGPSPPPAPVVPVGGPA